MFQEHLQSNKYDSRVIQGFLSAYCYYSNTAEEGTRTKNVFALTIGRAGAGKKRKGDGSSRNPKSSWPRNLFYDLATLLGRLRGEARRGNVAGRHAACFGKMHSIDTQAGVFLVVARYYE